MSFEFEIQNKAFFLERKVCLLKLNQDLPREAHYSALSQ